MESNILDLLVCPICKSNLFFDQNNNRLICKVDRLGYPIRDDIPVMLETEATELSLDEVEKICS